MKILQVIGGMGCGGAEAMLMNLFRCIAGSDVQFDFLYTTQEDTYYDAQVMELGGRIIRVPGFSAGSAHSYAAMLARVMRENGPYDAVHAHTLYNEGFFLKAAKKAGIPMRIAHSHSIKDHIDENVVRKMYHIAMRRMILQYATHYLACSREAGDYLFGKRIPCAILENAIDLSMYADINSEQVKKIREQLAIPQDALIIGSVGRLIDVKNHTFMIDLLRNTGLREQAHIIFVGDGDNRKMLEEKVWRNELREKVHFVGVQNNIHEWMQLFDVFLFPSIYEGLGIVMIEAQAAGTACVASDSVPPATDMGLGLTEFLSLQAPYERWRDSILHAAQKSGKADWSTIYKEISGRGYDVKRNAERLVSFYRNGTFS